jgi:hypothetical protein
MMSWKNGRPRAKSASASRSARPYRLSSATPHTLAKAISSLAKAARSTMRKLFLPKKSFML